MNDANKQLALDILSKFDFAGDIGQILGFIGQLRDLVDAFFQALGGNFGPLQDWVSDLVGGTVSGFEWLSDLTSFQPLTNLFATIEGIVEAITGSVGSLADLNSWFQTAFGDLWDVIGNIVNQILSALGITGSGSILDRIMDLADEFGHMLDNLEDAASGLTNLSDFVQDIIDTLTGGVGGGLSELADWAEGLIAGAVADFEDLMKAFQGNYSGSDSFLNTIQGIVTTLRGGLTGLIDFWRIPQLSLAQLTNQPSPNLLTGFGDFADGSTIAAGTDWVWDGTVGANANGSARTTGTGANKVLTSELIAVSESQQLTVSGKVRWSGVTGTGETMKLVLVPYIGSTAQSAVTISNITSPTSNSSGFITLSGSYTVPANITGVRIRFTVESALTAGTVWWDDISLTKVATSLPQQWINGLTGALDNIWSGINDGLDQVGNFLLDLINNLISGIRRIPFVGGSIADGISTLLSDLTGFSLEQQKTKNAVVAGATQAQLVSVSDQTSEQVQATVASLKAVADEQKARQVAYDLRGSSLYDGPLSAGDVTIPFHTLVADPYLPATISGNVGAQTAGTAHTHPISPAVITTGIYGNTATPIFTNLEISIFSTLAGKIWASSTEARLGGPLAAFVAKSDTPRKTIAFKAKFLSGSLTSSSKVALLRFNDEFDVWERVAVSTDFTSSAVVDQYAWYFAELESAYYPTVGELLAVAWHGDGAVTSPNPVIGYTVAVGGIQFKDAYPSFPYGTSSYFGLDGTPSTTNAAPMVSYPLSASSNWFNGVVPFAQVGPDSGVLSNSITPLYWFDNFTTTGNGYDGYIDYGYYTQYSTSGISPKVDGQRFGYRGTSAGYQGIARNVDLNTSAGLAEVTLATAPTSSPCLVGVNLDSNANGIHLQITNSRAEFVQTSGSSYLATRVIQNGVNVSNSAGDRFGIGFDVAAGQFVAYKNGIELFRKNRPYEVSVGVGYRRCAISTSRTGSTNSAMLDDFLMRDVSN